MIEYSTAARQPALGCPIAVISSDFRRAEEPLDGRLVDVDVASINPCVRRQVLPPIVRVGHGL